jgi:hypothetical protein
VGSSASRRARTRHGDAIAAALPPDPETQITPYALFRALAEGRPPLLVDLRGAGAFARRHLAGSQRLRTLATEAEAVEHLRRELAPAAAVIVLVDRDGERATQLARRLGPPFVALYGGLELWRLALVPAVVGETYLRGDGEPASSG